MKITCQRDGLLAACQVAGAATANRDVKPILRNLKAVAVDDRCTLMATDLEVGIRIDVRGVQVQEPGEAILTLSRILPILREGTDSELAINADNDNCSIFGSGSEFEMPSDDPQNFPDIPKFDEAAYHEIQAGHLKEMIKRVIFATASVEHSKFGATTGVLWELNDDVFGLVATDGRRLARSVGKAVAVGGHSTGKQLPVVPEKAMMLLDKNLTDLEEMVRVSIRPNEVLIKTERAVIYSRLAEGRFPNYSQVMPKGLPVTIPLVVGPFMSAVRQAAIMTDDKSKRVGFSFDKGKLTLQAKGANTGRSKVQLPVNYDGKAVEVAFDSKYVLEMLRVMDGTKEMTLELKDASTPALFKMDGTYSYVVVPLVTAA